MNEDLPPITASLWGILAVAPGQPQPDESDYRVYLEQKHEAGPLPAPQIQDLPETD